MTLTTIIPANLILPAVFMASTPFRVAHDFAAVQTGRSSTCVGVETHNGDDAEIFGKWIAGRQVSLADVEKFGLENCFAASEIDDFTFSRMRGKSYKSGCTIARSDLRYVKVLHYTAGGKIMTGEIVCNKSISNDLVEIFRALFKAKYPIESIVLVDEFDADDIRSMQANNTSCFNFRRVEGSKTLSNHSRGTAIDINPLYNPCVTRRRNGTTSVSPATGKKYADRTKHFDYKIDTTDKCYREFIKHGFTWGGNRRSKKDYQHFEKRIHTTSP